ncbi:MAG: aminoacyl-tRNA hydrolase [Planctomycetes bacterium]|nr:aminoacyl-tRNA hydrolase [Planctomycetota bacterium]
MIDLGRGVLVRPDELVYRATRAGGPGGQNVNKVATRIELTWDIANSPSLDDRQRATLLEKLATRLDSEGRLRLVAADARTQSANRDAVLARLKAVVEEALRPRKRRVPTKPTRASKRRRVDDKKKRGDVKRSRRRLDD